MKVIFEKNVEGSDYLEIILSRSETNKLMDYGIEKDFPLGLDGIRNLNVFIRVDVR